MTGLKLGISGITFTLPSSSSFGRGSYGIDAKTGWKIQDDGYASINFASFEGDSRQVGSLLGQTEYPDYISFDYEISRLNSSEKASEDIKITSGSIQIDAGGSYSKTFLVHFKPDAKVEATEKYQIRLSNPVNIELADHSNIECDAIYYCNIPDATAKGVYEFSTKPESNSEIEWKVEGDNPLHFKEGDQLKLLIRNNVEKSWLDQFEARMKQARPELERDGMYDFTLRADRDLKTVTDGNGYASHIDFKPTFYGSYLPAESTFVDGSKLKLSRPLRIKKDNFKEGEEQLYLSISGPFSKTYDLDVLINDSKDKSISPGLIFKPAKFKRKLVDKITNFNSSSDVLKVDISSFDRGSSSSFKAGKNKKKVLKDLARLDYDFLYDQKKGGLYFNENGVEKGLGDGGLIAILKGGPELNSSNLKFV